MRGELGAESARAQDPDRDRQPFAGDGADSGGRVRLQIGHQLDDIARELVGVGVEVAAQRVGGRLIGARRPAEAEIDAARIERFERPELLGDLQRRVIGQHDAAGADPDRRGAGADIGQSDAVAALAMPGML